MCKIGIRDLWRIIELTIFTDYFHERYTILIHPSNILQRNTLMCKFAIFELGLLSEYSNMEIKSVIFVIIH